ncbi:hypothetical protein E2C01_031825 [Portunus trituberculatus]|uniref:Uncharacterized protein n=1 Tax=Portunus trituberculatus TaxID=210409 RepID=A0A5B7EUG3_PORTR|nr:hypothetical protein [Portunus trituberculatus]
MFNDGINKGCRQAVVTYKDTVKAPYWEVWCGGQARLRHDAAASRRQRKAGAESRGGSRDEIKHGVFKGAGRRQGGRREIERQGGFGEGVGWGTVGSRCTLRDAETLSRGGRRGALSGSRAVSYERLRRPWITAYA